MKRMQSFFLVVLAASLAGSITGWRKVVQLRSSIASLTVENETLQQENAALRQAGVNQENREIEKLRAEARDVQKLRNEVNRLRKDGPTLEQLRAENQRLRMASKASSPPAVGPSASAGTESAAADHFPRQSWAFAGYASPESALVSAIWAMREGSPETYLESLAPEEQARLAKSWENKSQQEIAAKHQQDVASITGIRILERQDVSAEETLMNVYIEGVGRVEKVSMKRQANEWKFGGFRREPPK